MITFEFEGITELQKKIESIASDKLIKKTNKTIIESCVEKTKETMKDKIPISKDLSKSGAQHKGSRRVSPSQHARNNIPSYTKTKNGNLIGVIGWDKGDNEENFYMKFVNWGTSKQKPVNFIDKTEKECKNFYNDEAQKEYNNLIKQLE